MNKEKMQEAFDTACAAVIAQGRKSMDVNESQCQYRGIRNTKCAIGHLLTDDQIAKYNLTEGTTPASFQSELIRELVGGASDKEMHFLCDLQNAHDGALNDCFSVRFKARANDVAIGYGLKPIV